MAMNGLTACLVFLAMISAQLSRDESLCFLGNVKVARECCLMPRYIDKDIDDSCTAEHKSPGPRLPPWTVKMEGSCVVECIFIRINSFRNNSVDKEALKDAFVKSIGLMNLFGSITNRSVDLCYGRIVNNSAILMEPVSPDPKRKGCSFVPTIFLDCFKENVFMNCPQVKWIATAECNALKLKFLQDVRSMRSRDIPTRHIFNHKLSLFSYILFSFDYSKI